MKFLPENKARAGLYLGVIVIAGGTALYFLAFRQPPAPEMTPAAREHAAAMQAAPDPSPAQPELPVSSRSPRGLPVNRK